MSNLNSKKEETQVLHAGWRADPSTNSVAVPIYQTTSYQFNNADHAENLFALKELGNIYTRIMNPTCDVLEKRVSAFEGGIASLAVSSGQSATALSIQNIAKNGDNIVSSTDIYGGTWNLFANTLKDQGIEVRFVDPSDPNSFKKASDKKTRAYYGETLPNPKLNIFPIEEVANIGKAIGIPLIIDNTAAPYICKPFLHGASVVVHSTTKYIGGQGSAIGGIIVDGGNFSWDKFKEQQPAMNNPDPSYHGTVWTEATKPLGPIAYILKARTTLLRDVGSAMSPFNAFQFIQGIETLPLRIERQSKNAELVTNFLKNNSRVSKVVYPNNETKNKKYFTKNLFGNLIGFHIKGGYEACKNFINNLQLFYHVANIGDVRSLAIHPSSTTHSQLNSDDQLKAGVYKDYIRLSIGIEHIEDILKDLENSLNKI
ncbi:MAG: bifunctional O-acetylhomoserine aminocarboxypropyltransferase/cysteine synthase [Rickettsiales bacterium TMED254]|nr:O-acetylhomoserine aminocarboxypropyltransferase [Rickettsiales bacterium]RPF77246.1 MAG: bifunctional O-acetylhomoserine aminocarboxypropyltransferase/cysteine synthase [Rickettsiales bacterium TMED254]